MVPGACLFAGGSTGSDGLDSDSGNDAARQLYGRGKKRNQGRKKRGRHRQKKYGMGAGVTMGWAKLRHKRKHQGKKKKKNKSSPASMEPTSSVSRAEGGLPAEHSSKEERDKKKRKTGLEEAKRWADNGCMCCCLPRENGAGAADNMQLVECCKCGNCFDDFFLHPKHLNLN